MVNMNILFQSLVAALAFLLAAEPAARAQDAPRYVAAVTADSMRIHRGRVQVSFTLDLGKRIADRQHRRVLTPVLCAADGAHEARLPHVVARGRLRAIQEEKNGTAPAADTAAYCVLRAGREGQRLVRYRTSVPYEPWMDSARLVLRQEVTGCRCGGLLSNAQVVAGQALYRPQLVPSACVELPREFTPRREQRDAYLIYPVNQTALYPDRFGNRAELAKIDSALCLVQQNPAYEIRRIDITGYASPEGRYGHNVRLAQGRAEALKQYVQQHYDLPDTLLRVTPGAENWAGLAQALAGMELPYKDELLALATDTLLPPDEREARLRQVGGGQPYRMLLSAVYPGLRKNTFRISYVSRERTPAEARRLAWEEPGELNAYEFYTVARTYYREDPDAYERILLRAADTYPDNPVANNNAASLCLRRADTTRAARYLDRAGAGPATWNNRALLLWLQGRPDEAVAWWQKAATNGDEAALNNIEEAKRRGW